MLKIYRNLTDLVPNWNKVKYDRKDYFLKKVHLVWVLHY